MGMADRRRGACLVEEPLDEILPLRDLRQQHLDRGALADQLVDADVDRAHPAATELALDAPMICGNAAAVSRPTNLSVTGRTPHATPIDARTYRLRARAVATQ